MSVARDIPRAWVRPVTVMREKLARGEDERAAFLYLAVATILGFMGQLPVLVRRSRSADPVFDEALRAEAGEGRVMTVPAEFVEAKFEALVAGAIMAWLFVVPLILYALALLSHWVLRAVGGQGTALGARLALFWAALVAAPGMLLLGLTNGFLGDGIEALLVFSLAGGLFFWVWLNDLYAVGWPAR